jgi:hypothetical protein
MNLKMNLTYLLLLLGLVMFSNRAVYAQKETTSELLSDATANFSERLAQNLSRNDLEFGLTTNQLSYKSRLETRDEEAELIAMYRKYYRKDAEIGKASPVVLNSSFNYYSFSKDSTIHLETKEFYLNKSKNQQSAAKTLVGVGTTMIVVGSIGLIISVTSGLIDTVNSGHSGAEPFVVASLLITMTGAAADLVSIPFFISASNNKKKAATLSFGNQTIYPQLDKSYFGNTVPSLTLRIKL